MTCVSPYGRLLPPRQKKRQEQIAAAAMLADEKLARPLNYAAHRAVHLLRPLA